MVHDTEGRPYIIDDRKLIFLHIPRTGGVSICRALDIEGNYHQTPRYFQHHHPGEWAEYQKMLVVRDPVDRFLSAVQKYRPGADPNALLDQHGPDITSLHMLFRPASCWWTLPFDVPAQIDYVLRFENLAGDFARVSELTGARVELEVSNAAPADKGRLVDWAEEMVRKIYAADFNKPKGGNMIPAVQSLLHPDDIALLKKYAAAAGRCVDLGTYFGASALQMSQHCNDVITVDVFEDVELIGDPGHREMYMNMFKSNPHRYEDVARVLSCRPGITVIKSKTTDPGLLARFENESVGLLFVDDDHSEAGIGAAYAAWVPKVKKGGAIVFHDTFPPGPCNKPARAFIDRLLDRTDEVVKAEEAGYSTVFIKQ